MLEIHWVKDGTGKDINVFYVATWPPAMQALFDFQGSISTVGDHLLNPDCVSTYATAADLYYTKQVGYTVLPFVVVIVLWIVWTKQFVQLPPLSSRFKSSVQPSNIRHDTCSTQTFAIVKHVNHNNHGHTKCKKFQLVDEKHRHH